MQRRFAVAVLAVQLAAVAVLTFTSGGNAYADDMPSSIPKCGPGLTPIVPTGPIMLTACHLVSPPLQSGASGGIDWPPDPSQAQPPGLGGQGPASPPGDGNLSIIPAVPLPNVGPPAQVYLAAQPSARTHHHTQSRVWQLVLLVVLLVTFFTVSALVLKMRESPKKSDEPARPVGNTSVP